MKLSCISLLTFAAQATAYWPEAAGKEIRYSSVPGFFLQDDASTDPSNFDYAQHNFGLIDRKYPTDGKFDPHGTKSQWQRFARLLKALNHCRDRESVRYKILFMGRHGQGYHNVAETYYGTPAWNCYWAELDGNGTSTWADALLTPEGFNEAQKANEFYQSRYEQHMPHFESYYSSPLRRCIQTANETFATLDLPREHPFIPTIKELFREGISIHTCDRRSTKSAIHAFVPSWKFEAGFTENDQLWRGDKGEGETSQHEVARSKRVLDDVFVHDDAVWVSITSHSGEIASLLTALNHRSFSLSTGQIIPVLVKAEVVDPTPTSPFPAFTPEATCKEPPVTSIAGQGCICTASMPSPTA